MDALLSFFKLKFQHNPILRNELRLRMRGKRAFLILAGHLLLLSIVIVLIYVSVYETTRTYNRFSYGSNFQRTLEASSTAGKSIFYGTSLLLLIFTSSVTPAFTAGALVGEKERQTYDLLTITTLSARSIVAGKLNAIMVFILLLITATLPFFSMAYFFGGVTPGEMIIAILMLLVTTLFFSTLGLFISSFARSTTTAHLTTYAIVIPLLLGLPFLLFVLGILASGLFLEDLITNDPPWGIVVIITYIMGFLISINPLGMAVGSQVFIVETGHYFFSVEDPFSLGFDVPIIAPWIIYTVFNIIISLILIRAAIRRVSRTSKT